MIRSTKSGIPKIVSPISFSSSWAGITTAIDFCSSMRVRLTGRSGEPDRDRAGDDVRDQVHGVESEGVGERLGGRDVVRGERDDRGGLEDAERAGSGRENHRE